MVWEGAGAGCPQVEAGVGDVTGVRCPHVEYSELSAGGGEGAGCPQATAESP